MRYYLEFKETQVVGWLVKSTKTNDPSLLEVEPHIFKNELAKLGIDYELPDDKIKILQEENAILLLDGVDKGLKIDNLEIENSNLLLDSMEKEIRLNQTEEDLANILLTIGGM